MTKTEARHCNPVDSASGIAAVKKNNSTATTDMETAARLTGGVDLAAMFMPIVAACCCLRYNKKSREVGNLLFCFKYLRRHAQFLP